MKTQLTQSIALALVALSAWNCKAPDATPIPYESGVFILNSGNFSSNNGTISFLPRTGQAVATSIFQAVNPSMTLSGGVQGYTEVNGKGLILVDNNTAGQDKVEIIEAGTFVSRATLKSPDIENPRQVIQAGPNKAYISCWDVSGDYAKGTFYKDPGYIAVVDLNTSTVSKKIPAVKGVERMVMVGTEVFIGSSTYSGNKTLLIIDANTDAVKDRIDFGATPEPIALDADNRLWIQAGNDMVRINPQTRLVEKRLTFPAMPGSVTLSADKRTFYYTLSGRTYNFSIDATTASGNQVITRSFSALGIDPQTKQIYGSVIPSYAQAGYVIRYKPDGVLIDSVKAEIAPYGLLLPMSRQRAIMNWSGGKDSALALYHSLNSGNWDIRALLTSVNDQHGRISMHGVRMALLEEQAQRIGLPLQLLSLPGDVSMEVYDARMNETLQAVEKTGVTHSIFGDIFLEDLRHYRETQLQRVGLTGAFPLWQRNTTELIHEFVDLGFRAVLVCLNEKYLSADFAGRELDLDLLKDLPKGVDPCGENGEYHSFVYDGPIFSSPVPFTKGDDCPPNLHPIRHYGLPSERANPELGYGLLVPGFAAGAVGSIGKQRRGSRATTYVSGTASACLYPSFAISLL